MKNVMGNFIRGLNETNDFYHHPPVSKCQRSGCEATATRFVMIDAVMGEKLWLCPECFGAVAKGQFSLSVAEVKPIVVAEEKPVRIKVEKPIKIKVDRKQAMKEGRELAKLAGLPSKEDTILVYGITGWGKPWTERNKIIPVTEFQEVLLKRRGDLSQVSTASG